MNRAYFDHNATTPISAASLAAFAEAPWGNPSSIHREGQRARQAFEAARRSIAQVLGVSAQELVFTSGGTESNNLALAGLVERGGTRHIVTTQIEHPSVLETCRALERSGVEVSYVAPDRAGIVDAAKVESALRHDTKLVSVMHANNETGVVQPIQEIAALVRRRREHGQQIYFHCDGVQVPGRIALNLTELGADLYSISAHKVYGPKGVGCLYVQKGVPLQPVQFGGRHERGRRAGTENTAGVIAFGRAMEGARANSDYLRGLRDRFEHHVLEALPDVTVNGGGEERLPNTSNLQIAGVEGEALVIALDLRGFAISTGSACSSGSVEPSHVLLAMGLTAAEARQSVRISFGTGNTLEETDALASALIESAIQLREAHARRGASNIYVNA